MLGIEKLKKNEDRGGEKRSSAPRRNQNENLPKTKSAENERRELRVT